jgi:hypothetical protein
MTIIIVGYQNYFIEVPGGYKPITKAEAMELYEKGLVTQEEVINYEYD